GESVPAIRLQRGESVPAIRLQQGESVPITHLQQEESVPAIRLQREQAASSCKQRQAAPAARPLFKRGRPSKCGIILSIQQLHTPPVFDIKAIEDLKKNLDKTEFWFLIAKKNICLNLDFMAQKLAFIDMECDRLDKIVRKEAEERKDFCSTRETTEHSKNVNERAMELVSNIKKEIQLEELNTTCSLYKKMIEFVRVKQQEIRNAISKLQMEYNLHTDELQKRKEKVVEIEKDMQKFFSYDRRQCDDPCDAYCKSKQKK
ncbi:uncharacterized protein TNIN_270151, partial [Trichonephila inaurata madagascariensis]